MSLVKTQIFQTFQTQFFQTFQTQFFQSFQAQLLKNVRFFIWPLKGPQLDPRCIGKTLYCLWGLKDSKK